MAVTSLRPARPAPPRPQLETLTQLDIIATDVFARRAWAAQATRDAGALAAVQAEFLAWLAYVAADDRRYRAWNDAAACPSRVWTRGCFAPIPARNH